MYPAKLVRKVECVVTVRNRKWWPKPIGQNVLILLDLTAANMKWSIMGIFSMSKLFEMCQQLKELIKLQWVHSRQPYYSLYKWGLGLV